MWHYATLCYIKRLLIYSSIIYRPLSAFKRNSISIPQNKNHKIICGAAHANAPYEAENLHGYWLTEQLTRRKRGTYPIVVAFSTTYGLLQLLGVQKSSILINLYTLLVSSVPIVTQGKLLHVFFLRSLDIPPPFSVKS